MTRPKRSTILTPSSLWWVLKHALIGWWTLFVLGFDRILA